MENLTIWLPFKCICLRKEKRQRLGLGLGPEVNSYSNRHLWSEQREKQQPSHGKGFLKVLFFLSFYLKGADPYLIVGFQRKNESCQKCCQFFFYEAWQRTFYFLHILWDLKIDLGISPLKVHIIIPTCISKILFRFQRALAYMIQLCQSWQPRSVRNSGVSIPMSQMRELRRGWLRGFPRARGCYEESRELKPKLCDSLLNCSSDHCTLRAVGDPEETPMALLQEPRPFLHQ